MSDERRKIVLAGSGYLGACIAGLASNYTYKSILEYSRTGKTSSSIEHIRKDFDEETYHLDEITKSSSIIYMAPPRQDSNGDNRLQNFLSKLSDRKICKITYISTSGVYGDHNDRVVNEASELNPITARAKRRVSAEKMIREYSSTTSNNYIILRVPGIYGPDRLPISRIRNEEPVVLEKESKKTNLIHVEDLARISWECLNSDIKNEIFNVSDGCPITVTRFYREICSVINLKMPPQISMIEAQRCFSDKRLSFLKESRVLDISKMEKYFPNMIKYKNVRKGIKASL